MSAKSTLAIDVGEKRIGVAVANNIARLPRPLTTLENTPGVYDEIVHLLTECEASALVVGIPRGMQGQDTEQTAFTEAFVDELKQHTQIPVYFIDEAVTSQKARAELHARGSHIHKGDIDALAATYMLEDYFREQGASTHVSS